MDTIRQSEFRFSDPLLMEMSFSVNKEYPMHQEDSRLNIPIEMNVSRPAAEDCADDTAFVLLSVDIGSDGPDFPCHLSMTMGANFSWPSSLPKEVVDSLLSRNAPVLLLGYIRPYIAQITEASPVGALHLPFMNFIPHSQTTETQNES